MGWGNSLPRSGNQSCQNEGDYQEAVVGRKHQRLRTGIKQRQHSVRQERDECTFQKWHFFAHLESFGSLLPVEAIVIPSARPGVLTSPEPLAGLHTDSTHAHSLSFLTHGPPPACPIALSSFFPFRPTDRAVRLCTSWPCVMLRSPTLRKDAAIYLSCYIFDSMAHVVSVP